MIGSIWQTFRRNLWTLGVAVLAQVLAGILAVAISIAALVFIVSVVAKPENDGWDVLFFGIVAIFVAFTFVSTLFSLGAERVMVEAARTTTRDGHRAAFGRAFERRGRTIGGLFLFAVILWLVQIAWIICLVAAYANTESIALTSIVGLMLAPWRALLEALAVVLLTGGFSALRADPVRWVKLLSGLVILAGAQMSISVLLAGAGGAAGLWAFWGYGSWLGIPAQIAQALLIGWFLFAEQLDSQASQPEMLPAPATPAALNP